MNNTIVTRQSAINSMYSLKKYKLVIYYQDIALLRHGDDDDDDFLGNN